MWSERARGRFGSLDERIRWSAIGPTCYSPLNLWCLEAGGISSNANEKSVIRVVEHQLQYNGDEANRRWMEDSRKRGVQLGRTPGAVRDRRVTGGAKA